MKTQRSLIALVALAIGAGAIGCESNAGTGALIGGAGGAGLGAAIGSASHARAGEGALIGGAIGALSGAVIGNEADRQERERDRRYDDRYYDDAPRARVYRERDVYVDDPRPRDGYTEYRVYRSYDPYAPRRGYYETRRYYDGY